MEKDKQRQKKIKDIEDFTQSLKNQKDEEGNQIVEFPEDFDEMVQVATDHASLAKASNKSEEHVDWLVVYQAKHSKEKGDENYRKKMMKIRELDLIIAEKERQLKQIRSRDSEIDLNSEDSSRNSVFITRPGAKNQAKSVSSYQSRSMPNDKILKNIELAGNYKGHYSLIDRLGNNEKDKLNSLLEGAESNAIVEYPGIIPESANARIAEIDAQLRNMIPEKD